MIYFDNAATSFPKSKSLEANLTKCLNEFSFNAGRGEYKESKNCFDIIDKTRFLLSNIAKCLPEQVIFTSSATESLSFIINGLDLNEDDTVFVSPFEHNAIIRNLYARKVKIVVLPFDRQTWDIDLNKIKHLFGLHRPRALFLSHISNVTGYELPYKTLFEISKQYGCINVLDCAQSFGLYDIESKNVDFAVFTAHKTFYSIYGVGGLIYYSSFQLKIVKAGGTGSDSLNLDMPEKIPFKYESGSPNTFSIAALFYALQDNEQIRRNICQSKIGDYFLSKLKQIDNIEVYNCNKQSTHNIVSFNIKGYKCDDIGQYLSDNNICVRTGYHCVPFLSDFLSIKEYNGCIRVSFSAFNTKEEVDSFINILKGIVYEN